MSHVSEYIVFANWFGENSVHINDHCVTYSAFNFSSSRYTETNISAYHHHHHHHFKLQLSCQSVAVILTLVQTKQIINIRKR